MWKPTVLEIFLDVDCELLSIFPANSVDLMKTCSADGERSL